MSAVFGIEFSPYTRAELVSVLARTKVPAGAGARSIVTANLDHIVQLEQNADFRSAYARAWAVTADGMPVFVYARLRGASGLYRIPGSDLFAELLPALSPCDARCFFVASNPTTARRLERYLIGRGFDEESFAFDVPPHGFERDRNYSHRLAERIRRHETTHLFFGLGSPKSEIWIHRHHEHLGDCYALCVGAALEFFVKTKRRAPVWVQRGGFEWLWRFGQEPQRLGRRYFIDSWRFLAAIKHDLAAGRRV